MSRPPSRIRKWNQLNQFRGASAKVKPAFLELFKDSREAASVGPTVLHTAIPKKCQARCQILKFIIG